MKTKYLITIIVIAVIAFGVAYFGRGMKESVTPSEPQKSVISDKSWFGAVSSLDAVDNPYVTIGGVQTYYYFQPMIATSSVPCSIKNPYGATSTLMGYYFQVASNTIAVAQRLDVSTSSSPFASGSTYGSSTPAFIYAFSAGAGQFSGVWAGGATTTSDRVIGAVVGGYPGTSNNIIGPTDYITLRIASSSPGTFTTYYKGTCSGIIQKL